ncbi:MAG TPA: ATP-binding protein [Kiritimatiellia bacterium]|nr:ATP-binding protein [Kiritimatiellia bacterium]
MAKKPIFDPKKLMEKAVEVMKASVREHRSDDTITPKVGAVLWKPDGTIETACRGELREGDHAEYTLIERKNGHRDLSGCVLFATLEPCGPDSRNPPKIGCARRITNARIRKVYYGCQDPHPKVAGEGLRYLEKMGVETIPFDRDLQEAIELENAEFFDQARRKADEIEDAPILTPSPYDQNSPQVTLKDLDADALAYYRQFLFKKGTDGNEEFHRRLFHQGLLVKTKDGSLAPTRFAHLLFGKHPRDILPQAGILATIHGRDGEDPEDFDGPMVLGPSQVIAWLRGKWPDPIDRSEAQRKRLNDSFYELVREGIANALVHRDYDIEGCKIQVVVEGDTVTIRSPGAPVAPIKIEQLQSFSAPMVSRNPRLHAVFSTMELAEERGLGLKSMRRRATEVGLPLPKFRFNDPYLDLVLYRSEGAVIGALAPEIQKQLSNEESDRFKWVARRDTTTSEEFAKEFGVDGRTARRNLNKFVGLGLVEPMGAARARKYRTKLHE